MPIIAISLQAPSPPGEGRLPASDLYPLRQGDLDSFCGLYAAINGIRIALAAQRPLIRCEVARLFSCGVALLAGRSQLTTTTLTGFDDRLWRPLLRSLVFATKRITGCSVELVRPLAKGRPPSLATTAEAIETAVRRGQPALIELSGRYDHYTVVSGYTPTIWRLFDSGTLRRLTRKACGIDDADRQRHIIRPGSLTILKVT